MTVDAQMADPLVGDFNGNGSLDAQDIDMLTDQIVGALNSPLSDLNGDSQVDLLDHRQWVVSLKNTWYGDADLNGELNTGDMVAVFQAGEYEDLVPLNSRWSTGDWNGDKEFNTTDLVTAFQDGGFERGPRQAAVLVPEPTAFLMFALGALIASHIRWYKLPER
jgi:hypothetical protein